MRNRKLALLFVLLMVLLYSCSIQERTISLDVLRDKIKGGWAGKMIGVSYGGPTEFRYNSVINEDEIKWNPTSVKNSIWEDDLYVQMSFMMTMDEHGIDAPAEKFAKSFANA
ncbi:MAG: ADP-ribosylglycohydrolase family protein [Candidatus Marinimicrobia bacterium]|nr:ADP-ribosylglycohydrolase family protein [Candidatus Neomarinimicrobiota bacterium]